VGKLITPTSTFKRKGIKQMNSLAARKRLLRSPHGVAAIAFLISLTTLGWSAQLPVQSTHPTISNFGKINDHYFRGAQPNALQIGQLKRFGIKTVIDLRKDFEEREEGWVREQGMQYFRIPLTTESPATADQTAYFLRLVNDPDNWPIYVHCKGGKHRTGEMTAIYRITRDKWTADQAYAEMKKYQFESGLWGGPDALKKHVFRFYEANRTAPAASVTQ